MIDHYPEDEKRISFDELSARAREIDKQVKKQRKQDERAVLELERIREQDRKQWEYTNGGRNPVGDDPIALDGDEHKMYENLGIKDMETENNESSNSIIPLMLSVIAIACFVYLVSKYGA